MPEAVAAEVLTAEPPCDYDDVVPQSFPFEHAKDDHAGSALAVVVLDHLIAADEASGSPNFSAAAPAALPTEEPNGIVANPETMNLRVLSRRPLTNFSGIILLRRR